MVGRSSSLLFSPAVVSPTPGARPLIITSGGPARPCSVMAGRANHRRTPVRHDDRRLTRHRRLREARAPLGLEARARQVALLELGQHFLCKQLHRGTKHVVRDTPGLRKENDLVDARLLELAQSLADKVGRADAILDLALGQREILGLGPVALPQVGLAGLVAAEKRVVAEPVKKEAVVVRGDLAHPLLVAIAQKWTGNRYLRVYRVTRRLTFSLQRRVVVVDPLARLDRRDEREGQRAQAQPRRQQ